MSFSTGQVRFTKYEFPYNGSLDPNISYTGAFAITRDNEHKSLIHIVYSFIQYLLNKIFNIDIETDYHHGMIVIRKPELQEGAKQDELIIANVTGRGLRTKRVNYLNYAGNDATSLVVYVPTDDRLRTLISKYGVQTAYVPDKHRASSGDVSIDKQPGRISIWKLSTHWLKKPELCLTPPKDDQRVALAVADLLAGKQFLNKKGNAQEAYFCMDYATTVLQSAILIRGLEEEFSLDQFTKDAAGTPLGRNALAAKIHQKLTKKGDKLHTLFIQNPIMQADTSCAVSGFIANQMNKQSIT
jgi:hypothetical protein